MDFPLDEHGFIKFDELTEEQEYRLLVMFSVSMDWFQKKCEKIANDFETHKGKTRETREIEELKIVILHALSVLLKDEHEDKEKLVFEAFMAFMTLATRKGVSFSGLLS